MLGPAKSRNSDQFFEACFRRARLRWAASSVSDGEALGSRLALWGLCCVEVSVTAAMSGPPLWV